MKLTRIALALPYDPRARHFVFGVLLAFLPAAVIGALAHDFIKTVLFETPMLVCVTLIVGGIVLIAVDRMELAAAYTTRWTTRPRSPSRSASRSAWP